MLWVIGNVKEKRGGDYHREFNREKTDVSQ